jgi:transposase
MAERRGPTDGGRFKRARKDDEVKLHGNAKLTDEIQKQIVSYIEAGSYLETACRAAGISKVTLYNWFDKARRGDVRYVNFMNSVEQARGKAKVRETAGVLQAGQTDWRARAWWLERTAPKEFGRQLRLEGDEENPVHVETRERKVDLSKLSVDELRALKKIQAKMTVLEEEADEDTDDE